MINKNDIRLRPIMEKDLKDYFKWNHPDREFHKFNGPYFKKRTVEELKEYVNLLKEKLQAGNEDIHKRSKVIANTETNELIGTVSWYWKSEETLWMEIGIVIFNENYWGHGIGFIALKKWISEIFETHPEIVRLGLTTWSGNPRMMNLAKKLGFKQEACYRNARIVDRKYYDSVSYGILRTEWNESSLNI